MKARQSHAHIKIISNCLRWLFEAWEMKFAQAMKTRQNISKSIHSKVKEKGIIGAFCWMGREMGYPDHPARYKHYLTQDPVLSHHYSTVGKTEQSLKLSDMFSSTYAALVNISSSLNWAPVFHKPSRHPSSNVVPNWPYWCDVRGEVGWFSLHKRRLQEHLRAHQCS